MKPWALFAVAMLAGPSAAALADDYPFTGYFASVDGDASVEDAQRTCALSFFRQEKNGDFINYLIDVPAFEKDGTVRYDLDGDGVCILTGKLEECTLETAIDPDQVGMEFSSVITAIGNQGVKVVGFDAVADARRWVESGAPAPDYFIRYERCVGFDEALLEPRFTGKPSTAPLEENDKLGSTPTDETRPLADAIRAKLLGSQALNPESD